MRRFTIWDDLIILFVVCIILIPFVIINGFFETQVGLISAIILFAIWIISVIVVGIIDKQKSRREALEQEVLKQQQEEAERMLLESMRLPITCDLNPIKKDFEEHKLISKYLDDNKIQQFYYFTNIENVERIKIYGGLLSHRVLSDNSIDLPILRSNIDFSVNEMENDDYIHLYTSNDCQILQEHLLAGQKMVKLSIRTDVALWRNTLFVNMQPNGSCSIDKIPEMQNNQIETTEILVKESVPIEYIQNIDYPKQIQPILYFDDYLIIDARNFTIEEQLQVERAQVVDSTSGTSACFFMKGGGFSYIPMSPRSKLGSGDAIDMKTARIITLSKQDSYYSKDGIPRNIDEVATIIRIE